MAARATGMKLRRCSRAASSGTTPPYAACSEVCEETTFETIRPFRTTAALVSSQDVSNARTSIPLLGRCHLLTLGYPLLGRGGALREQVYAVEKVDRAVELEIVSARHTRALAFIQTLDSAGRALQEDIALLLVGDWHGDVRSNPLSMNYLMARGVVFRGRQAQGRAIVERQDALD